MKPIGNVLFPIQNTKTIKSMTFSVTVDEFSQISLDVPGTIIAAVSPNYLLVVQAAYGLRAFGDIANLQLNRVAKGTTIKGTVFFIAN